MGKHCNNSQCFKEKNYKSKFSISSILKKIKLIEIILEKNIKRKKIILETL
jgi:glutaminase